MVKNYILCLICCLALGCEGVKKEALKGKWTAVQLTEEGDSLKVNLDEITLDFHEKGYGFTSTLNYKEAGIYTLKDNLLTTLDSLNEGTIEKVVEITRLQNDSLYIRMNEEGKERLLVMTRNQ